MQKGQAHAKKRRTNPILLLVILALVVFLGVELIRVGKRLNEAAQQAETAQRELQKAEYELQVAKDQQRKAEDEVLTLQGRQDHYDLLLESLRLSCETMEQELSGLDRRETDGRRRMAGIQADITAAEDRAAALRQEMRNKLAGQTDLTEQTNQLAQAVSDKKADQAALSAEKDSVLRSVEDLRGLQADMVSDRAERDRRVQEYRQANEKALADMAGHQAALEEKNARVIQLRQRLEEYTNARTEHDEVMAVKEFIGTFYHNCGNRRLDQHMLAIQGQQTLLRYIYASCLHERAADVEVFHEMLLDTINGDADSVCDMLQKYTDHMTLIVESAVTEM